MIAFGPSYFWTVPDATPADFALGLLLFIVGMFLIVIPVLLVALGRKNAVNSSQNLKSEKT